MVNCVNSTVVETIHYQHDTSAVNPRFECVVKSTDNSFRCRIYWDTGYPKQSYAVCEVWRDKWQEVVSNLPTNVKFAREQLLASMEDMAAELLAKAKKIVEP